MKKRTRIILTQLLILFVYTSTYSQKTIVGIVSNIHNESLANVKVTSLDNQQGVLTNLLGEYMIEVEDTCAVLTFSLLDQSFNEAINSRKVVNKQMTENNKISHKDDYRFNIMINAGGPLVWGAVSGSILLADFMSLDVGVGIGKFNAGTTIYLNSPFMNKDWQPYVGANIAYFEEFMGPTSTLAYMPVGLRYLNYKGTSVSFELAFLASNNDLFLIKSPVWGGIRFGKYF